MSEGLQRTIANTVHKLMQSQGIAAESSPTIECSQNNGTLYVALTISPQLQAQFEAIVPQLQSALGGIPNVEKVLVTLTAQHSAVQKPQPHAKRGELPQQKSIPFVKHIVAISSAKGGVGKSTIAANVACALAQKGLNIGLLDVDIYGPSQPTLFGVPLEKPTLADDGATLIPISAHGVKLMSIGFLLEENSALIWRGPMVTSAITQMLFEVEWGTAANPLDILVLDLPPGTGDAHLSIVQKIPLNAVVIVSTPQEIALADVRRGLTMFNKVDVPIIGIVENMSLYCCPNCRHEAHIFGHNGAAHVAEKFGVPLLAQIPLTLEICERSDAGVPIIMNSKPHDAAQHYHSIANNIIAHFDLDT